MSRHTKKLKLTSVKECAMSMSRYGEDVYERTEAPRTGVLPAGQHAKQIPARTLGSRDSHGESKDTRIPHHGARSHALGAHF
jgi:hypothetical protein